MTVEEDTDSVPAEGFLAEQWFNPSATADDAISKYMAAPPRGMTNPPQNPKVRRALLEYLGQTGAALETSEPWPPPQPPLGEPGAGWAAHKTKFSPARSKKGSRILAEPESMMSAMRGRLRGSASSPELSGCSPELARYNPLPTYSKRLHYGQTGAGRPEKSSSRGAASQSRAVWHQTQKGGAGADPSSSSRGPRGSQEDGRISRERREPQDSRAEATDADKEWASKETPVIINDLQLARSIEAIRGQVRLHRAAVGDRFSIAAEGNARSKSVVLRGAAAAEPQGGWTSDASALNICHNSAMRTVNPSHLAQLPDFRPGAEKKVKKKKKKTEEDDIDSIQLSDSGLFTAQYPTDEALKSIRRLRRTMFPKEEAPAPAPGPMKRTMTNSLGAGFADAFRNKGKKGAFGLETAAE